MAIKFLRRFGEFHSGQVYRLDAATESDYIRHGIAMRIAVVDLPTEERTTPPRKRRRKKRGA